MSCEKKHLLSIAIIGLLAAAGVSFIYAQDGNTASPALSQTEPYRLQAGDVIELRLFFNPELNEQVQIRPDGRISLQLLGEVAVAGKSITEAVSMLEARYAKEIQTPRLTIQVRAFAGQRIFVTGEVERPGVLNMPGTMTVLEAVSEAGGIKKTGDRGRIILIRKGPDGKAQGKQIALFAGKEPSADALTLLRPFDVLIVPETKIAHIDRWVDQHIRQLIPITASMGFTYLWQNQTGGIPIF
jgi:protein involved in polysaccharide export with SLBB domain